MLVWFRGPGLTPQGVSAKCMVSGVKNWVNWGSRSKFYLQQSLKQPILHMVWDQPITVPKSLEVQWLPNWKSKKGRCREGQTFFCSCRRSVHGLPLEKIQGKNYWMNMVRTLKWKNSHNCKVRDHLGSQKPPNWGHRPKSSQIVRFPDGILAGLSSLLKC